MFGFFRKKPKTEAPRQSKTGLPPAQLLLLSKFLAPRSPDDFTAPGWTEVLQAPPAAIIYALHDAGLLTSAGLADRLNHRFKVSELKSLLKLRGLPVSGKKETLISRLVEAAPDEARQLVDRHTVYICTASGRALAEGYLAAQQAQRTAAEQATMHALQKRDFRKASHAVAAFEAQQVFSRGIGIDWTDHDPSHDIALLQVIFKQTPRILGRLPKQHTDTLRLAAAMQTLWGVNTAKAWLPADLELDLPFSNEVAARMWSFFAINRVAIEGYRKGKIVKAVEILAAKNPCPACQALSGTRYALSRVPQLPHEHCTSPQGCRCTLLPLVDLPGRK